MADFTHFDANGASRMVDVGDKPVTHRIARAEATVRMLEATRSRIAERSLQKGDVVEVARLAGIQGAKRTADLIPLCHPLGLDAVRIEISFPDDPTLLRIEATAEVRGKTGVEMEALVAASTAALTVYDMCKAIDRGMTVEQVRLLEKTGGKSGHYVRED
ncbi:MAG: cyclic pyranopterin monophosphate synthase MoaC [Planctomycetales bacterium]|nr:cyclic pyranopterin monophosphate synthase MoaC [Planctomycetales bacterium]